MPSSLPCNRRTDHDEAEKIFALRYLFVLYQRVQLSRIFSRKSDMGSSGRDGARQRSPSDYPVLVNDFDSGGTLDPASVVVTGPSNGTTVVLPMDGNSRPE